MTMQSVDLTKKHPYQIGVIHGKLLLAKEDLHMGNHKEALAKVNEILKYLETEIIPEFYKTELSTTKEDENAKEKSSQENQQSHEHSGNDTEDNRCIW